MRLGQPALLAVLTLLASVAVRAQSSEPLPPLPDSRADPAAGAGEMAPMRTGSKAARGHPAAAVSHAAAARSRRRPPPPRPPPR